MRCFGKLVVPYLGKVYTHTPILKYFIYLLLERQEKKEKERGKNINQLRNTDVWEIHWYPQPGTWPATQTRALTGNQTSNFLVHRLALSSLSHTSQGESLYFKTLFNISSEKFCTKLASVEKVCQGNVLVWKEDGISRSTDEQEIATRTTHLHL